MASRSVRKLKRSKNRSAESGTISLDDGQPPSIVVTLPEIYKRNDTDNISNESTDKFTDKNIDEIDVTKAHIDKSVRVHNTYDSSVKQEKKAMKFKPKAVKVLDKIEKEIIKISEHSEASRGTSEFNNKSEDTMNCTDSQASSLQPFDVSKLIAELSQNSKSSSTEIQNIQRKLLQQANEILRDSSNAFHNQGSQSQNFNDSGHMLNSQNQPNLKLITPPSIHNSETQLIPERLQNNDTPKPTPRPLQAVHPLCTQIKDLNAIPQMNNNQLLIKQSVNNIRTGQLNHSISPIGVNPPAIINQCLNMGPRNNVQGINMDSPGTDPSFHVKQGIYTNAQGTYPNYNCETNMSTLGINSNSIAGLDMQRVAPGAISTPFVFLSSRTGSRDDAPAQRTPASARAASTHAGVTYDDDHGVSVYAPVPPPAYRMPPAPDTPALPGSSATPTPLHTHSSKFPIEREVILSSGDKNSKIPILHELKKRVSSKPGVVAPDVPIKTLAWSHANMENQQPSTSNDPSYRQQYHDQTYMYTQHTSGAVPRNIIQDQKPPIPGKNISQYPNRDQKAEITSTTNNSQSITVTVETGKDNTKDAPKSSKSVTKTYYTLKDMISSRFKGKDTSESEIKNNESEVSLNNVTEELRKSPRDRDEHRPITPREIATRKMEPSIYGRPMPQNRDSYQQQMMHNSSNNLGYNSPSPHQQMMAVQHQIMQQQIMMNQQHALGHGPGASSTPQHKLQQNHMMARSQEMLSSTPQHISGRPASQMMEGRHSQLVADGLYQQQYGIAGRRSGIYQREDIHSKTNFTSLKQTGPQTQYDNSRQKPDIQRSPQQLEREIIRQRVLTDGKRTASHSQLDDALLGPDMSMAQSQDRSRRNSHSNILEAVTNERSRNLEELSDDGGFRTHRIAQNRSSFENKIKRPPEVAPKPQNRNRIEDNDNRRMERERTDGEKNDENSSQKSVDSIYNSSSKAEAMYSGPPQPAVRQTPNRIEDLKGHGKKGLPGSAASSDYDKNGGQSSNVDSGRGSVAYSSGRRPDASLHDTSADSDALGMSRDLDQPGTSKAGTSQDPEWVDIVESELRQILEPKMQNLRLEDGARSRPSASSSVSSVTPPLPPLSPGASDSTSRHRRKHQSLPLGSRPEYSDDYRKPRGRDSPPRGWQHQHHKQKHSIKRDHHSSSHYKKQLFGLDTTDITSTTTRSLDLSSLLDGQSDSDVSTQDARAIRRQLQGLENMYCEVLKLLGVRKPTSAHGLGKYQPSDPRLAKRRYGSMSSLPSSSVSSRPIRDKRRTLTEHRKKNDLKTINKRFQRLESHVVTLARSVAHLSSEMRTQHLVMQEMDTIRAEIAALRHMYKSQAHIRGHGISVTDPQAFSNPDRVKRLTKFFGDEPPLMRLFLKKLGYEKYASLLEAERVGAAELPYVGEDRLRTLGVPLGPRMRILKEAGAHQDLPHMTRDAQGNTSTTLAIV